MGLVERIGKLLQCTCDDDYPVHGFSGMGNCHKGQVYQP